jgi:hypothetical protein
MSNLFNAARKICESFIYDPGHSDLDDEQPIHIHCTLGDWRRLNSALMLAGQRAEPEDKDIKAMFDGFCTDVEQCPLTYADCYATIKHLQACIAKLREQSTPQHGGETK